ncbi:hypothetical protein CVT26_007904 [Gymnopilus dilepis]|uniref:Uncharacterized protein n=1 Tax=Gymnopilus dilepis TaxID=231916 RepID=A0A409YK64_9AGAR|nr:hypothetical protein CVT26_007904 [Gymnopilus dilepis]
MLFLRTQRVILKQESRGAVLNFRLGEVLRTTRRCWPQSAPVDASLIEHPPGLKRRQLVTTPRRVGFLVSHVTAERICYSLLVSGEPYAS